MDGIDLAFPKAKTLSVIVDEHKFQETTLQIIIQRTSEKGRKLRNIGFATKINIKKYLSDIVSLGNHVVIIDCHGIFAEKVLKTAKDMGLAGTGSHFYWLLTERTMGSLPLSWLLPDHNVFGVKLNCNEKALTSSYLLSTLNECNYSVLNDWKFSKLFKENR